MAAEGDRFDGYDGARAARGHGVGSAQPGAGQPARLGGLLAAALRDPLVARFVADAGKPVVRITGPVGLRAFIAAALGAPVDAGGAGVPVCLDPVARVMRGIGHDLGPPVGLPPLPALLVNPRVAVPTAAVFRALAVTPQGNPAPANPPTASGALTDWLQTQGNDLETPARTIAPVIGDVLDALRALPGADVVRMSGSGATCFALFPSLAAAKAAEAALSAAQPHWWVRGTTLH